MLSSSSSSGSGCRSWRYPKTHQVKSSNPVARCGYFFRFFIFLFFVPNFIGNGREPLYSHFHERETAAGGAKKVENSRTTTG